MIQEHTNETFFENIYKLPASHNLTYNLSTDSYLIKRYYSIQVCPNKFSLTESISLYENKLKQAIGYRLRSDVKVGTCLSGGLDSSTVSTLASAIYSLNSKKRFAAIHAKSSEKEFDESYYARLVSEKSGLDLNVIEPSIFDFKDSIDEVVYTQEEPFGSPSIFMQYFVMRKANEIGCKVMLDGQGGDETLLGYEKYYPSGYIEIYKELGIKAALNDVWFSSRNNSKMGFYWILKYTVGSLFPSLRKFVHKRATRFLKPYDNKFCFLDRVNPFIPDTLVRLQHS